MTLATGTGELQRLGTTAIARAEARWLAGEPDAIEGETTAALALALEHRDRWRAGALAVWRRRAVARAHSEAEDDQRHALVDFQCLGSRPAADWVARTLRAHGARSVSSGPRRATAANLAGLTARELEVLTLLANGMQNSEIAARLFVSSRTAGHHVAAILRKLDVRTRSQAAAEAARLGIIER